MKSMKTIERIVDKYAQLKDRLERLPGKRPEWGIMIAYVVMICVVTVFHEPWFDEAQSWAIAKDASYYEILFVRPHFEGHPSLWHLILSIPAKLGLPYEPSLKAVSILFAAATVYLILFYSPFPRIIKCLIPFNYFVFYQYGVISRNYSVMMLAFVLCAMAFKEKDRKPLRFVLALILLCQTSAYGLLFACGIAIAWLLEMKQRRKLKEYVVSLFRDKRAYCLALLLFAALLEVWQIVPDARAYAVANPAVEKQSFLIRLVYSFLIMPADAFFYKAFTCDWFLGREHLSVVVFFGACFIGAMMLFFLCLCAKNKDNWRYFWMPYVLFCLFAAFVYCAVHHIGVVFLYGLFWCWCNMQRKSEQEENKEFALLGKMEERRFGKQVFSFFCFAGLAISVSWSICASALDIQTEYGYGRETGKFIKEHHLDELRAMTGWGYENQDEDHILIPENTNGAKHITTLLPYFDHNFVVNYNLGNDNQTYCTQEYPDDQKNEENKRQWRKNPIPDLLIGSVDLDELYGAECSVNDYAPVYKINDNSIWKDCLERNWHYLYLRRDLLEQYHLEEIPVELHFTLK